MEEELCTRYWGGGGAEISNFPTSAWVFPFSRANLSRLLSTTPKLDGRTTSSDIGIHRGSSVQNSSPKGMKNGELRGLVEALPQGHVSRSQLNGGADKVIFPAWYENLWQSRECKPVRDRDIYSHNPPYLYPFINVCLETFKIHIDLIFSYYTLQHYRHLAPIDFST